MELLGKIKSIGEVQTFGNFKKVFVVLITQEQYEQHIEVEFYEKQFDELKKYKVGDIVKVGINIKGREWANPETGDLKHFNSIQGWRLESVDESTVKQQSKKEVEMAEDDLPF